MELIIYKIAFMFFIFDLSNLFLFYLSLNFIIKKICENPNLPNKTIKSILKVVEKRYRTCFNIKKVFTFISRIKNVFCIITKIPH